MKLTKSDLKAILKECLLELIQEGVLDSKPILKKNNAADLKEEKSLFKNQIEARRLAQMIAGGDSDDIQGMMRSTSQVAPINEARVNNLALEMAKGDKSKANLYAAIFADTAANTLPQQIVNDVNSGGMPGMSMTESVSSQEIDSMANGDAQRWAKIAFAGKKKPL